MTTKEAEEIVRSSCIAANPSIMELGFGCQIIKKGKKEKIAHTRPLGHEGTRLWTVPEEGGILSRSAKGVEILGREIQLADVLLVLHVRAYKVAEEQNSTVAIVSYMNKTVAEVVAHWKLLLPFSLQSHETKVFLANLLK